MPDPAGEAPYPHALRPGAIGALELPHRIVMGSMHLGSEADATGDATAAFYAERARNGAGLIVTGGAAVSREGAGGRSYAFVNEEAGRAVLAAAPAAVHAEGGLIALQLFHAGRYAFQDAFGLQPVAPSAVASRFNRETPRPLDEGEIAGVLEAFAEGARHARELGYDAVELMGSEGYLVDQFLSPLTNLRDDDWGGDAPRRRRFGVELARAVRSAVGPAFPVIFRLTGEDFLPGSTAPEDVLAFAAELAGAGVDALNVGVGWHESPVPTVQGVVPEGAFVPRAEAIKAVVGELPVIVGNRVASLAAAERILREGAVDLVSMARPFLADPALVAKARDGRPVNPCIACNQACIDRSIYDGRVSCMVNPRAGRESEPVPARSSRRIAVVGGGPAGMEAARALAELGADVELFEADDELGGQFRLARLVPGKEMFGGTIDYFAAELARLGVRVRLGRRLTEADADELAAFDGVVLATGVRPREVDVPGRDLPHVVSYAQALTEGAAGEAVAIVGAGGIGVDVAHRLAHDGGPAITLMRRGRRIGEGIGKSTRWVALDALRRAGVRTLTGVEYVAIEPGGLRIAGETIPADTVVIAAGQEREDALAGLLARLGMAHVVVGGARHAGELDAVRAFAEGLEAAYALA
jgi:2,4-dienoyl-CoA reductase (NADPH2)